jgi:hypothetical protein
MSGGIEPTMAQVITEAIEARLLEAHTCFPGQVVKYDKATQRADIQPCLKRRYADGRIVSLPVIVGVPVRQLRAGKASIHVPVKAGTYVEVRVAERSLDVWLAKGGVVDPDDARHHHLTDAIATPGLYPDTDPAIVDNGDDLTIQNDAAVIRLQAGGRFMITSKATGKEMMSEVVDLIQNLLDATVLTMAGPQHFDPITLGKLTTQKANFEGLKGS